MIARAAPVRAGGRVCAYACVCVCACVRAWACERTEAVSESTNDGRRAGAGIATGGTSAADDDAAAGAGGGAARAACAFSFPPPRLFAVRGCLRSGGKRRGGGSSNPLCRHERRDIERSEERVRGSRARAAVGVGILSVGGVRCGFVRGFVYQLRQLYRSM